MLQWLQMTTDQCMPDTEATLPHISRGSVAGSYGCVDFLLNMSMEPGEVKPSGDGSQSIIARQTTTLYLIAAKCFHRSGSVN